MFVATKVTWRNGSAREGTDELIIDVRMDLVCAKRSEKASTSAGPMPRVR